MTPSRLPSAAITMERMMLRSRLAAAVAALLVASSIPAVAGGWSHGYEADYDSYYDAPAYGYRSYGIAAVPVVTYEFVPVPFVSHQRVLIVNQGPTYVPTSVGYIWPTVEYAPPRTFPYGSSGYGRQAYYGHRHHHRHHHVRSYRGHHPMPGYK